MLLHSSSFFALLVEAMHSDSAVFVAKLLSLASWPNCVWLPHDAVFWLFVQDVAAKLTACAPRSWDPKRSKTLKKTLINLRLCCVSFPL